MEQPRNPLVDLKSMVAVELESSVLLQRETRIGDQTFLELYRHSVSVVGLSRLSTGHPKGEAD